MNNKSKSVRILAIVAIVILVPLAVITFINSTATSEINFKNPKNIAHFASSGNASQIVEIHDVTLQLLGQEAMAFNLGRLAATSHGAINKPGPQVFAPVKAIWTEHNWKTKSDQIRKAWAISVSDPSYKPFQDAHYQVDSWLGTSISDDGMTSLVVVNGRMVYTYADSDQTGNLEQSQIKLVKENGNWRLDQVVAVHIGNQG